jgi:hypothetical protein
MSDPNPLPDPVHPGPDEPDVPEPPAPEGGQDHDPTEAPEEDKHPDG